MTASTRASLSLCAASAVVAVLIVGAAAGGALAQNTNGGPGPFMGRGGPPPDSQGGPGGRGGRGERFGQGGPMGALGPLGPIVGQLDLSDAQRDQVRAVVESHRDEMQALGERARPAHQALQAALTAENFDEGGIRARYAEVANVEADVAVAQARVYSEVFRILTPEQQAQVKKLQTEMKDRGRGRGPRPPQ